MDDKFELNLVTADAGREEALLQIADAIEKLDFVLDSYFASVNSRIASVKNRLNNVSCRVAAVESKVERIKAMNNRALTISAPAKYPEPPFSYVSRVRMLNRGASVRDSRRRTPLFPSSRLKDADLKAALKDKQRFYHFEIPGGDQPKRSRNPGIKKLPANVVSVSDLLIFNSSLCPYRPKQQSLKEQKLLSGKRSESFQKDATAAGVNAEEAPAAENPEPTSEPTDPLLDYSRSFLPVPAFNVPEALPDLPGVADFYSPTLTDVAATKHELVIEKTAPEISSEPLASVGHNATVDPASLQSSAGVPEDTNTVASIPPAPSVPLFSSCLPPPSPPSDNGRPLKTLKSSRADLMAAIRNAGGAEKFAFRSVADGKQHKKFEQKESIGFSKEATPKAGTSNIMNDLKVALENRRKGITGRLQGYAAAQRGTAPDDIMKKLAESIPAPESATLYDLEVPEDDWNS